jgi:N-methylhydantoinase A
VEAPVPPGALGPGTVGTIVASFEAAYRALYQRLPQGVAIEALNWRLTVSGPPGNVSMRRGGSRAGRVSRGLPTKTRRPAFFVEAGGFVEAPVYDRYGLTAGATFEGPAIVEERESTAILGPGARCRVDDELTLVVDVPWSAPPASRRGRRPRGRTERRR